MFDIEIYKNHLRKFCETIKLDYFPQMQASDLLYKVITIQELYMPVTLYKPDMDPFKFNVNYGEMQNRFEPPNLANNDLDIDALIAKIDEKIAELEEEADFPTETGKEDKEPWVKMVEQIDDLEPSIDETAISNIVIQAVPGSGKTTFCKRLILALIDQERDFLGSLTSRTSMLFDDDSLPIFISFRNLKDLKELLSADAPFEDILYQFSCNILNDSFVNDCSCEDFRELLWGDSKRKIYLFIDGWDELFDVDLQRLLEDAINKYLQKKNDINIVFTIRTQYQLPDIFGYDSYKSVYEIKKLDSNEIIEYCRKYYNVIYRDNEEKRNSYQSVAENIIKMSRVNPQIQSMAQLPLSLSQLFTLSRYDGRLPENKSELNNDLLDLYVGWATKKNDNNISHNKMRTLLAYIATYMTKNNKFMCSLDELKTIIRECVEDLSGVFSEELSDDDISKIIVELDHTAIFGKRFGDSYGFAVHRTMQEYLTAYAIVTQNADAEYNEMLPLDIFRDKYEMKRWREVIVYAVLMNDGRLRQGIVNDLMKIAEKKEDDNYVYTNLLFEFIINSVPIKQESRHQIYDLLFQKHITDIQISQIHQLMLIENDVSRDFVDYIDAKFLESVKHDDSEYGYAMAVIKASKILEDIEKTSFIQPSIFNVFQPHLLYEAERLIIEGTEEDIVLGYEILLVIAWCKYAEIKNVFCIGINDYKLSNRIIDISVKFILEDFHAKDVARSIKDCILAGFVTFEDLVDESMYNKLIHLLNQNRYYAEILLSMGPVRDSSYRMYEEINEEVQEKYIDKLNKEIAEEKSDDIIFSYSICAIFDPNMRNTDSEIWKTIKRIYNRNDSGEVGKIRYKQIAPEFFPFVGVNNPLVQKLKKEIEQSGFSALEFIFKEKIYIAKYKKSKLSRDGRPFIETSFHIESISAKNNLSYLYRRGEISEVIKLEDEKWVEVNPKELLWEGVQMKELFSMINYALTLTSYDSETTKDSIFTGLDFLINHLKEEKNKSVEWKEVISWWSHVLTDVDGVEGLIVLYWLFKIGNFDLKNLELGIKQKMSNVYKSNLSLFDDNIFADIMQKIE